MLCWMLATSASATELDSLLASLAQPLPAETAFVEQRQSRLLAEPLLLRGRLSHPRAEVLVKQVQSPYAELTTVEDGRVEIVREGDRRRRFSLRNAPELAGLLASFQGMLSGDRALLERHYAIQLEADGDGWTMVLSPRDARLARRITGLRLSGRNAALECVEVLEADGDGSRMLVGAAGETPAGALDETVFDAACR
jgi:hypothetical protein